MNSIMLNPDDKEVIRAKFVHTYGIQTKQRILMKPSRSQIHAPLGIRRN